MAPREPIHIKDVEVVRQLLSIGFIGLAVLETQIVGVTECLVTGLLVMFSTKVTSTNRRGRISLRTRRIIRCVTITIS